MKNKAFLDIKIDDSYVTLQRHFKSKENLYSAKPEK